MATMAELRAALEAQNKKNERKAGGGDGASYPFWNIKEGETATVRFLPDADESNPFFWVERQVIRLPFAGVVGQTDNEITINVPCVDMFGEQCPIIAATRPWWKDPAKEAVARKYWKKKSYIFNGFVVSSPFVEENVPENPIRRFVINPMIFKVIQSSLMNPEMEDMPTDYVGGRDFKIAKTRNGEFANYSTSSWSFKTRTLSETEQLAIEQHGLFNLKDFLGRRPDAAEMEVIKAMFDDSVNGLPFDIASYGEYYKPYGMNAPTREDNPTVAAAVDAIEETFVAAKPAPAAKPVTEGAKPNASDILEKIRNRTQKTA